jgi:hypothetical protein
MVHMVSSSEFRSASEICFFLLTFFLSLISLHKLLEGERKKKQRKKEKKEKDLPKLQLWHHRYHQKDLDEINITTQKRSLEVTGLGHMISLKKSEPHHLWITRVTHSINSLWPFLVSLNLSCWDFFVVPNMDTSQDTLKLYLNDLQLDPIRTCLGELKLYTMISLTYA